LLCVARHHRIKINVSYRETHASAADPFETFGYGFKLPDNGHWQSGTIGSNWPHWVVFRAIPGRIIRQSCRNIFSLQALQPNRVSPEQFLDETQWERLIPRIAQTEAYFFG
jgi:hypothetical protein